MGYKSWEPVGPEHISSLIAGAGRVMSHVWIQMFLCSTVRVDHTPIWVSYKYRLAERILAHLTDLFVRKKNWGSFLFNLKGGKKSKHEPSKKGREIMRQIISTVPNGQTWPMREVVGKDSLNYLTWIQFPHSYSFIFMPPLMYGFFFFSLLFLLLCLFHKGKHSHI